MKHRQHDADNTASMYGAIDIGVPLIMIIIDNIFHWCIVNPAIEYTLDDPLLNFIVSMFVFVFTHLITSGRYKLLTDANSWISYIIAVSILGVVCHIIRMYCGAVFLTAISLMLCVVLHGMSQTAPSADMWIVQKKELTSPETRRIEPRKVLIRRIPIADMKTRNR